MARDADLVELTEKHRALEEEIEDLMGRPLADTLKIAQLKKEKLAVKDQIAKLEEASSESEVA